MKAVYAGSFDCYTNGHHDIVKKAVELFDELHILIAENCEKSRKFPAAKMKEAIERTLEQDGISNCRVVICGGTVADYCSSHDIKYIIRGLRDFSDFEYEEKLADINKVLAPEVETMYLRADNAVISSSLIRELCKYKKDVSKYVPAAVCEIVSQAAR